MALVDELRLIVFPVAIGGGLRVFLEDRGKVALKLTDLVRYDSGVLLQGLPIGVPGAVTQRALRKGLLRRCLGGR
jgi:hypothetical protein